MIWVVNSVMAVRRFAYTARKTTRRQSRPAKKSILNGNYWDGRLTFTLGAVYVNQESGFAQNTGPDYYDPTGYSFLDHESFESDAIYAQSTYKFTDELELTLGARYSYDHKEVESVLYNALGRTHNMGRTAA